MMRAAYALIGSLLLTGSGYAQTEENTGPNENILRWKEGQYAYRTLSDGRDRGWEKFRLMVHPDDTRTMIMWHDLNARNAQFTVVLKVDEDFRPMEAYVDYFTENGHKGSGIYRVDDEEVEMLITGTTGVIRHEVDTDTETFSLGTHPVSADGWHRAVAENGEDIEDGKEKDEITGTICSFEASSDLTKPMTCLPREQAFGPVSEETITTPAGTFDTYHYQLGPAKVWVLPEDRLLVRMVYEQFDREYVLTSFESANNEDD